MMIVVPDNDAAVIRDPTKINLAQINEPLIQVGIINNNLKVKAFARHNLNI